MPITPRPAHPRVNYGEPTGEWPKETDTSSHHSRSTRKLGHWEEREKKRIFGCRKVISLPSDLAMAQLRQKTKPRGRGREKKEIWNLHECRNMEGGERRKGDENRSAWGGPSQRGGASSLIGVRRVPCEWAHPSPSVIKKPGMWVVWSDLTYNFGLRNRPKRDGAIWKEEGSLQLPRFL